MTNSARKYLDWIWIVAINFLWATQVAAIKLIGDRLGPVAIAFVPMFLSIALFFPALLRQKRKRGTTMRRRDLGHFVLCGIFGVFLTQFTYTLGAQRTLAANAAIITLSIPVIVAIAASFSLGEKLNIVRVFGFLLALGGVLLTSAGDLRGADFAHGTYLAGNLLFLLACIASAIYNTYAKFLVDRGYTELEVLVYTSVVGCLTSLPLFFWYEPLNVRTLFHLDTAVLLGILEIGLVVYGMAMLLFFSVLKRLDVTQATLGNYLLPFFMALLAVAVLKEHVTPLIWLGGAIVLLGTLLVTVYESRILAWWKRLSNGPRSYSELPPDC